VLIQIKKTTSIFFGTIIFFIAVPFLFGQEPTLRDTWDIGWQSNSLVPKLQFGNGSLDTTHKDTAITTKSSNKKFRMRKSPWIAVVLSAVVPGLGQLYNQSYWKVPVILGLSAYLGYQIYDNHKKYKDYRSQYAASQTPGNELGNPTLYELREFYRNQRDDFIWYFTIVYVVNLIDAYVDAHLFDFDVREEKIEHFGKTDREYKLNFKVRF
jgi:hypothetical protein